MYYTPRAFALVLGVSSFYVRKLIKKGLIRTVRIAVVERKKGSNAWTRGYRHLIPAEEAEKVRGMVRYILDARACPSRILVNSDIVPVTIYAYRFEGERIKESALKMRVYNIGDKEYYCMDDVVDVFFDPKRVKSVPIEYARALTLSYLFAHYLSVGLSRGRTVNTKKLREDIYKAIAGALVRHLGEPEEGGEG